MGVHEVLGAAEVRRWCRLAADALGRTRAEIDRLNVFPVPDGDTGTNLHLTVLAATEALDELPAEADTEAAWRALAQGALLGARGNSGVILSQVFLGLADVLGKPGMPQGGRALGEALGNAAALARSAVAQPVEGTILSVLVAASAAAVSPRLYLPGCISPTNRPRPTPADPPAGPDRPPKPDHPTLANVAGAAAAGARAALLRTTGQLEVLAANGVVDAGAAGMCVVLDTLAAVVTEEFPDRYDVPAAVVSPGPSSEMAVRRLPGDPGGEPVTPTPGYEVMYLLEAPDGAVQVLKDALEELGDSLVVVGGDGLWNVHVHVDDAGAAIEAGFAAGRAHRIRVTYLHATSERQAPCTERSAGVGREAGRGRPGSVGWGDTAGEIRPGRHSRGIVAVTAADGLAALFEGCGATVVRRAPGTVPPMAVLLEAILGAGDEVAVLPNELEVLAVAAAAAERARDSGVRIAVLPTRSAVQGLAALAVHDPLLRFPDDVIAMTRAAGATRFGHLEVATHEAVTSAGICQPGDVLGLIEDDVWVIGSDLTIVAHEILSRMLSGGGELATLITGAAAPAGLADAVESRLRAERPDVDLVVYEGAQERFPVLVGVE